MHINASDHTCAKYASSNSGLPSSFVSAIAIDSAGNERLWYMGWRYEQI